MALRLIECALSVDAAERVLDQLDRDKILGVWKVDQSDESQLIRILASAERTEKLVEQLEDELSFDGDSRIMLSEVLATVPEPEPEDDDGDSGDENVDEAEEEEPPGRVAAIELSSKLNDSVELNANFVAMVVLSTVVASVGLINDDTAVVIGAMVIAPLLAPNVSLALATTLGDLQLLKKSGIAALVAFAAGALLSSAIGLMVSVDPSAETLVSRTDIGPGNIALALAAGAAGAIAFTAGVSEGIVGVMVAVALLPSLAAAGLFAGDGQWELAGKAFLLFVANVVGVNLAAIGTFVAKGLKPNFVWDKEEKRAKRDLAIGIAIWTVLLAVVTTLIIWVAY